MNRHSILTKLPYRIALCCTISVSLSSPLFAQGHTLAVEFENDSSRTTRVGIFRRHGILYASMTDLAEVFTLKTYINPTARKFELKQPPLRVKVAGGNPFVVFTDETGRQSVYQLPSNVLYAANAFFVPLSSFLPCFSLVFDREATLDTVSLLLRIKSPTKRSFDFSKLILEPKSNGMLIRIPATKPFSDVESWLKQDGWLYVTIANARADTQAINGIPATGIIQRIVAIQSPTSVQLTFKLSGKAAAAEILRHENSNDLLISIRTPGNEEERLLEAKRREVHAGLEAQRARWKLDVIVIDPGHGGRDFGAIGVTRLREKEATLGIALKLGGLIEKKLKGVKVVYTRKDDSFVELDRRGQIANAADGKLFISIHCNSLERKPSITRGFEVYLLQPGRTEDAIAIAERENSVITLEEGYEERYQKLTEENFILVTMAQSAHVKASELFADVAQQELEDHLSIPNRGVKQAGFYVLVGASMPNVLVETAYLSNREDERFLKGEYGQTRIAEALFKAIRRYKVEYEKLLLEGKELGQK